MAIKIDDVFVYAGTGAEFIILDLVKRVNLGIFQSDVVYKTISGDDLLHYVMPEVDFLRAFSPKQVVPREWRVRVSEISQDMALILSGPALPKGETVKVREVFE